MKESFILCLLVLLSSACHTLGFQWSSGRRKNFPQVKLASRPFLESSSSGPHNATSFATGRSTVSEGTKRIKPRVFTNQHYVESVRIVPTRASRRVDSDGPGTAGTSTTTSTIPTVKLPGGHHWLEIAKSLRQAASSGGSISTTNKILPANTQRLLQEASNSIQDIGVAWIQGDWEAVSYAALDASQQMELVATSLNKLHKHDNALQRALAGVSVELYELATTKTPQPRAITLQGLSLRLYQASKAAAELNDKNNPQLTKTIAQLENASKAARSLAKMHGAKAVLLPRRVQLWWHSRATTNK